MTDLRLISEPPLDDLDLRVSLESLIDGALIVGDTLVESSLAGDFVLTAALCVTYKDLRSQIRRLRALMRAEHS